MAVAALIAAAAATPAAAQAPKPDEAVKMRQGVLTAMKWQLGHIAGVAKGEIPFSEETVHRARNLSVLTRVAPQGFAVPSGSDAVPGSKAKPEIWASTQQFTALWSEAATEAERLLLAAQNRDAAALKAQAAAVGAACKACHDRFRLD